MKRFVLPVTAALLAVPAPAAEDGTTWATAIATRPTDGRRIIYRFIQEYVSTFDRSEYPIRVTLSWRYDSQTGMPSVSERESMDRLEDLLGPEIDESSLASLALVRTGDNLRQWTYYTKSGVTFRAKLDKVLRGAISYPVNVTVEPEPGWETYDQFKRGVRK